MRFSASFIIGCSIFLHVSLVANGLRENAFGKNLCANMGTVASHSRLLEEKGNRTTCVVSVTDEVLYTTAVATVMPLDRTSFDIQNLGVFELELTGECNLDPCYKVINSPDGNFTGNYVYSAPGMVDNELAFIAVYDCKSGEQLTQKAEFYDASPEIVEVANTKYGLGVNSKDLEECVERANGAAE